MCPSQVSCFNNKCCTPTTCAAQGKNCGKISDGCGGMLDCGNCMTAGETCGGGGTTNVCGVCMKKTCTANNCGLVGDGCGGTLDCGFPCDGDAGMLCYAERCCTPKTCVAGVSCGDYSDGCGGMLHCGGCDPLTGQTCGGGGTANVCGTCVP